MKYIDAEKLIAEIKRRIESWTIRGKHSPAGQGRDTCESRVTKLSDLLSFTTSLQQEQPEVDYNKFEKLFDDFCERNKGHHITSHDACMWFWELGLNARKEESK